MTMRRLHTRILGFGSVCGLPASPPAEVFLKSLPPPAEVDPVKYHRFAEEEKSGARNARDGSSPEPFYDIVAGAAGHRHIVLFTREGNLITCGDNRYGQTAAAKEHSEATGGREGPTARVSTRMEEWAPQYIDLDGAFATDPSRNRVACGSNFSIAYQKGTRLVVAFGNNHVGQLGAGHKDPVGRSLPFVLWDADAPWWPPGSVLESITTGYNHSIARLSCGSLFAFGSNTWGELGIGSTDSPMMPTRIPFCRGSKRAIKRVAAGNSFSLFLTEEGRVYGCGATNYGQVPPNAFEPTPIPLMRSYQLGHGDEEGQPRGPSLIRVRDIACFGSMAVFLSGKNELFLQGALPEYGVTFPSPRIALVNQQPALEVFSDALQVPPHNCRFKITELHSGPSTLLVRYQNGCVGALGANAEGQLCDSRTNIGGKAINLAPAHSTLDMLSMMTPALDLPDNSNSWFVAGHGFTLLIDPSEQYNPSNHATPIELPPGGFGDRGVSRRGAKQGSRLSKNVIDRIRTCARDHN